MASPNDPLFQVNHRTGRHSRPRLCLLKGCERPFQPSQPQCRYCSPDCQQAARRWRRWHANQRYRLTQRGKERRRAQSRRYRIKLRQASDHTAKEPSGTSASENCPHDCSDQREGQRPLKNLENLSERPCCRPGCYEVFFLTLRSPAQHFCSHSCRNALWRVLDREARWRRRHWRVRSALRTPTRRWPDST